MARRSSQKRRSDPNAPKRSKLAWQMFFADNRQDVAKQYPHLNNQEIMKKLGEMWRQSDEGTKRRYQKQYQAGQAEYEEKMTTYREEQKNKRSQSSNSNNNKNSSQSKKSNNNSKNNYENNNNGAQSKKSNNYENDNNSNDDNY